MRQFSVRYNLLFSAAVCGVSAVLVSSLAVGLNERQEANELLFKQTSVLESGTEAAATIVEFIDTGTRVNYDPEVRIVLDVQPEGADSFQSETLMVLTSVDAMKYQPGKSVRVRYDPENPSVAAIVDDAN